MATRTSVGTGAWSAAGTWDTGVPLDGDDVVIASGHTVTFDVDQSSFTTGVGITITGTLNHTTTTGTYLLKAKTGASIVGAGTWNIGTSGTPIPFAAKHTITGAAGWAVDGNAGLTMTVFGAEPAITHIKLSGDEAIGQTELSVDTDVTGDIWAVGDIIEINDINKAVESEERVIATDGIAEGTITITAGLTAAKSSGAYIVLITRNVKIIGVGTGTRTIYRVASLTIGGGMLYAASGKYMIESSVCIISGGAFANGSYALNSCSATISGGVFSNNGLRNSAEVSISGGLFTGGAEIYLCANVTMSGGLISGCASGVNNCNNFTMSGGSIVDCGYGFNACTDLKITGGTFTNNNRTTISCLNARIVNVTFTAGIGINMTTGELFNVLFDAATEHGQYDALQPYQICQSYDHNQSDGALKAWCKGGVVTSQTSVKPDGYTQAYLLDPESAVYPVFFTKTFSVEPSKTVAVEVQLRKDASMTYLPRVYLMASIGNPLAGATAVDSFTMTDSTNTWESDTFTIVNSTNYDQDYTLWFVAQNATDNAYAAYDITTEGGSGGGGAVSIQPISGRLGL